MEKVIAIFDIGKTNKKVLLFNQEMQLISQYEEKLPTTQDDDNFECDNAEIIVSWIKSFVESIIKEGKYDLQAINFSTYGATLAFVGEYGKLACPLYNYLKPMPKGIAEPIYDKFGGIEEFSRCTASPAFGMLNSGLQILWLKKCKSHFYQRVKHIMHFPQYLSYCFTGKVTSEYTSIGSHTALWNFDLNKYHQWLKTYDINLPPPLPNNTLFNVDIAGKSIGVGIGIHDSSASLVPYLLNNINPFILVSTGTWSIFMNPFNKEPLTREQLSKDTLCYMSTLQQQVKSSMLFMGHIHDVNVKHLAEYFAVHPDFYKEININEELLNKILDNNVIRFFIKGIPEGYVDVSADLLYFSNVFEAYHQLIIDLTRVAVESLKLIVAKNDPVKTIYISGGFARNNIFLKSLTRLLPDKQIYTSEVDNSSALGAALTIYNQVFPNTKPQLNLGINKI